jgi:alkyl hydroperoxide reductase subunit AhpC
VTLGIGDTAPDLETDTTCGPSGFTTAGHLAVRGHLSPRGLAQVCTTELGYNMAKLRPEFDRRNFKVIGPIVNPVDARSKWRTIPRRLGARTQLPGDLWPPFHDLRAWRNVGWREGFEHA